MSAIFFDKKNFNGNISWDLSNVENMDRIFAETSCFNQNLERWNVGCA